MVGENAVLPFDIDPIPYEYLDSAERRRGEWPRRRRKKKKARRA
jgi:hypothetical protein